MRVPGFVIPDTFPYSVPKATVDAERKAEEIGLLRSQIMNVHQACLSASESIVMRRGAAMGFPITAWSTEKTIGASIPVHYHDDTESTHALARNVLDGKYAPIFNPGQRRTLELEVVAHSFSALDHIIGLESGRYIPIVEAAYQSACRATELRFGESIAIGWTACEQLVSMEWKRLLQEDNASRSEELKMSRERRKKLEGRDYTASVMVEVLELNGRLSGPLYRHLEIARKARNNWAHDMLTPTGDDIHACLQAIQELLARKTVRLHLSSSFRGAGGPSWTLEMFQRIHGTEVPGFMSP